jgi:hypothetical protein
VDEYTAAEKKYKGLSKTFCEKWQIGKNKKLELVIGLSSLPLNQPMTAPLYHNYDYKQTNLCIITVLRDNRMC